MTISNFHLSYSDQDHLLKTRSSARQNLTLRQLATLLSSLLFLIALCVAIWIMDPPQAIDWVRMNLIAITMLLSLRVKFETPLGYTTALQIAFVPMLFVVPVALIIPVTVLLFLMSSMVDVVLGRIHAVRLLRAPGNAWFAVGPVLIIALTGHSLIVLFPLMLVAQFTIDFLASSLTMMGLESLPLLDNFSDLWVYAIDASFSGIALAVSIAARHDSAALLLSLPLLGVLMLFAQERTGKLDSLLELNETYRGTALLLGDVVEADDQYTGEHSQGVVELVKAVGEHLKLDADRQRNLEFAALLHDVGKIAVPKEIINKPGKLTSEEFEIVKTHAVEGQRMLAKVGGFMEQVGTIVRSHHERWDGGGYPDGLLGDAAPLEARIITACDSWSAMRTDRPYRQAMPMGDAVAEIIKHTGSQFDPTVAQALLSTIEENHASR